MPGCVAVTRVRGHPPFSVLFWALLYCAELASAAVLCAVYGDARERLWTAATLVFALVPALLTQLALTFVHRDLGRDRPLVLLLHLLLLGPVVRCIEALVVYFQVGKEEEPYVTISRKMKLKGSQATPTEREIGHSEHKLATHRNAFRRAAVIQAFLGSAPQLTLQLYITIQEKDLLPERVALISITLLSVTYGALVCTVLAIQIKYDDYKVRLRPVAYLCMALWRSLEILTRTTALVLFGTALRFWVIPVGLGNLLLFFGLPWLWLWRTRAPLPDSVEKSLSRAGTLVALCLVTFLYACINTFCYSVIQLNLTSWDLVDKHLSWAQMATYYALRFAENAVLVVLWYFFRSDFYEYVCVPLLVVQLAVGYLLSVTFMMLFYQYCHPCRHLFRHNVADCLRCGCCRKDDAAAQC